MISGWTIYFITILNNLATLGTVFSVILGSATIILCICAACAYSESVDPRYSSDEKRESYANLFKGFKKYATITFFPFIFALVIAVGTPSTKEAIAIWAIPKVVNNEQVQMLPHNFAKLVNKKINEWMEDVDLIPKKEENVHK